MSWRRLLHGALCLATLVMFLKMDKVLYTPPSKGLSGIGVSQPRKTSLDSQYALLSAVNWEEIPPHQKWMFDLNDLTKEQQLLARDFLSEPEVSLSLMHVGRLKLPQVGTYDSIEGHYFWPAYYLALRGRLKASQGDIEGAYHDFWQGWEYAYQIDLLTQIYLPGEKLLPNCHALEYMARLLARLVWVHGSIYPRNKVKFDRREGQKRGVAYLLQVHLQRQVNLLTTKCPNPFADHLSTMHMGLTFNTTYSPQTLVRRLEVIQMLRGFALSSGVLPDQALFWEDYLSDKRVETWAVAGLVVDVCTGCIYEMGTRDQKLTGDYFLDMAFFREAHLQNQSQFFGPTPPDPSKYRKGLILDISDLEIP